MIEFAVDCSLSRTKATHARSWNGLLVHECTCLNALWSGKLRRTYPLAVGVGGTGRMISEATFHSSEHLIQFMIIKNGLGVPSCPAYDTVIVIGA